MANVNLPGYVFYQGKDSGGNDIGNFPGTPKEIMIKCNSEAKCKGFNTNGWVKHTILPKSQWSTWTQDPAKGTYLRNMPPVATVEVAPAPKPEKANEVKIPTYLKTKEVVAAPPAKSTIVKAAPVAGPAARETRWSRGRRGRGRRSNNEGFESNIERFESNIEGFESNIEFLIAADMTDLVNENATWGSYLVVFLFIMLVIVIAMIFVAKRPSTSDAALSVNPSIVE